ncbi:MAG: leucine-rich repeat protein [Lachnospiraceae bacterium]|nr:leucine-rich repeat protein [Lachnospiraceae bacterium]
MEVNRCLNCMEEIEDAVCPKCGYNYYKIYEQPPMALKPNTVLSGRYLVGKMIGQGGFGMTYIGFDLLLNIKVCIKEYFPMGNVSRDNTVSNLIRWNYTTNQEEQRREGCESFLKEARKMAKLDSISGIVRVRDTFYENQTAYIIMDFIEGKTLKQYLSENGTMDYSTCINMLAPMMSSLSKVHGQELIHRDISPDNMMVTKDGSLMLLDLGAAKDVSNGREGMSQLVTKKGFSPAEQYMESGSVGPWTDVYAFCATIYYCMYGKLIPEAMERVMQDPLTFPPLPNGTNLPDDLVSTLMDGLAVYTENRIQSMDELLARLSPYVINTNQDMLSTMQAYSQTANTNRKKEKKRKKKKIAKVLIPVLSVMILAVAAVLLFLFKPWLPKVKMLGNSNSNMLNDGGFAIKEKEYEYFLDHNTSLYVCKYDSYDGYFYPETAEIVADDAMYINIGKDKVYYMVNEADGIVSLNCMDFDGTNQKRLYDGLGSSMLMQYALLSNDEEYLYYVSMNDNGTQPFLFRYNIKTGKQETIIEEDMCWYNLYGKSIYYTIFDSNNKTILKKCDLDGKHKKTLNSKDYLCAGFIENDKMFLYSITEGAMCELDFKGKKKNVLYDASMDLSYFTFAYGDGWIYYVGDDKNTVYRIREDGTANGQLLEGKYMISICFVLNELWFQEGEVDADGNLTLLRSYMCYKDGSSVLVLDDADVKRLDSGLLYKQEGDGITICGYEGEDKIVGIPIYIDGLPVNNVEIENFSEDNYYFIIDDASDFEYEETNDGNGIIITKYLNTMGVPSFIIPDTIDGKPVVEIGKEAFKESNVESVVIPGSVERIDEKAFYDCTSLETVFLKEGVEIIGVDAFGNTAISEIELPESLERLEGGCFSGTKLTKVYIPKNVTYIFGTSFCFTNLTEYDVDPDNQTYASVDGVLYSKNMNVLMSYPSAKSGTYEIPASVASIVGGAFFDCNNVTEISIEPGSKLTYIVAATFIDCDSLTKLDLSNGGDSIEAGAIYACRGIKEIYFPRNVVSIPAELFADGTMPDTLTYIKYNAECNCEVEWPEGVTVETYEVSEQGE